MNIEVTGELGNAIKAHGARQGIADKVAHRELVDVLMPRTQFGNDRRRKSQVLSEMGQRPSRYAAPVR